MLSACRLDELAADANTVARPPQAALDHVADPELAGELFRICSFALVAKAGIARHDREPPCPRQLRNQVLGHAVEKELGLGVATKVLKRQDSDRRFFRWRSGPLADRGRRRGCRLAQYNPEGADRTRDVLDLVFAQILEGYGQPIADLVAHRPADVDPPRLRQGFHARGDVDALPVNEVAIRHHVAHGDREAKPDLPVDRHLRAVLRHLALHLDCTAYRIDNAVELDQQTVAHGSHDAAPVRDDREINEIAPDGVQRRQGALLVYPHQAGIADDIRTHDDGKLVFDPGICHSVPASPACPALILA